MPPLFPPLPPEQVALAHTGVSILVGTTGPDRIPAGVRGVGLTIRPDRCGATVFLPEATSAVCRENLTRDGRIALTFCRMATHYTIQLKGKAIAIRAARDDERPTIERYIEMFAEKLAEIGSSSLITRRMTRWPATAIEFEIAEVYAQTPGPDAGCRMPLAEPR